jgi:hypothetical protein
MNTSLDSSSLELPSFESDVWRPPLYYPFPFGYAVHHPMFWEYMVQPLILAIYPLHPKTSEPHIVPKRQYLRVEAKIEELLALLDSYNWTVGDLLYYLFRDVDEDTKEKVTQSNKHMMIQKFLSGVTKWRPSHIIVLWLKSKYGQPRLLEKNPKAPLDVPPQREPMFVLFGLGWQGECVKSMNNMYIR